MQALLVFSVLVALSAAMPQHSVDVLPVVTRTETRDPAGAFSSSYQTHGGAVVSEHGSLKRTPDGTDDVLVKQGSFSYLTPEGTRVQFSYTADEYGFHPSSASIPQPVAAPVPVF